MRIAGDVVISCREQETRQSAWVIRNDSQLASRLTCLCLLGILLWGGCSSDTPKKTPDKVWSSAMQNAQDALTRSDRHEAERFFLSAIQRAEQTGDDQHLSASLGGFALLRYSQGKYTEAEQLCARQITVDEKRLGTNSMVFADELARFAELEEMLKKYERAEELYRQAQAVTVANRGSSSPLAGIYLAKRAHLYMLQGKKNEARLFYNRSLNFLDDAQFNLSFEDDILAKRRRLIEEIAKIQNEYALICEQEGRIEQAEDLFNRAIASLESIHGQGCAQAAPLFENLARVQKQRESK